MRIGSRHAFIFALSEAYALRIASPSKQSQEWQSVIRPPDWNVGTFTRLFLHSGQLLLFSTTTFAFAQSHIFFDLLLFQLLSEQL